MDAYLLKAAPALVREIEAAVAAIADEPSWGEPGRYLAHAGPYSGHIIDLNVPGHRIVYRYPAKDEGAWIFFRAIRPYRPSFPETGISIDDGDDLGELNDAIAREDEARRRTSAATRRAISMLEDLVQEAQERSHTTTSDEAFSQRIDEARREIEQVFDDLEREDR